MGALDYTILAAVAVWFLAAMRSILKRKGGCGCCGTSGTAHTAGNGSCCGKDCGSCCCCKSRGGEG
ncbi:MAG: hypothetical protein Q4C61_14365 [Lachnospiraceae bacterium]|nr:hypothetical protein [Lachnospiraceae bacterium]